MNARYPSGIDEERAEAYRRSGHWGEEMLADHIAGHAAERPDDRAYVTDDGALTWAQYDACSTRLASVLRELGIDPADRVAIQLPDAITMHVALLACEKAGVVAIGVGSRAGMRELTHVLGKAGAAALITHDRHRGADTGATFARLAEEIDPLHHHVVVPRFELDPAADIVVDGVIATAAGPVRPPRPLGPDDLWMINSTSGTTGLPKCVMHSQNRWAAFHRAAVEVGDLRAGDTILSVVPVPYGFGLWTSHFTPAYLGSTTVVVEQFDAARTLDLIEREQATVLCAVATQFRMLLADPSIDRRGLSSLRLMFTGGEAIPYEPARLFEERTGAAILNFYGSNESGFATATRLSDPPDRRLRTAGRPVPGTELRLFDDEGADVTAGGRGQPGTRGPAVCLGYLDDPVANEQLFTADGFVMHADFVLLDEEGYLTVVGRKSDIIIRGGKNISAVEVEDEISAHPRVRLAAAVAMPDAIFGERVCAFVELNDDGAMELPELVDFLLSRDISKELLPERLIVLEEMPRSSGGKIAKADLRGRVASAGYAPPKQVLG
jgi:acyl-CoA synthetase